MPESITFTTTDGRDISGELILPEADAGGAGDGDAASPAVVVHPATGVDMNLYRAFAGYLAGRGMPVLIYDFRGTGASARPGDRKDHSIGMGDWIMEDVPAATRWMRGRFPDRPLIAVAHSVGAHGQMATDVDEPVDVLVNVASHAGITRLIPDLRERLKIGAVFNVVVPLTSRLMGEVPIERLGMGKPIPVGVMEQWGRWTRRPGYFFDDPAFPDRGTPLPERYAGVRGPVLSLVFTDDLWATREASDVLVDKLTGADVERRNISPESIGAKAIGHMGFFRSRNAELWPEVVDWAVDRAGRAGDGGHGGN